MKINFDNFSIIKVQLLLNYIIQERYMEGEVKRIAVIVEWLVKDTSSGRFMKFRAHRDIQHMCRLI